ncbi:MAG: metal ABC transporter substrate-binding protein [Bacteroidota bacterium]
MNNTFARFTHVILIVLLSGSLLVSGQNRQQNRYRNQGQHRTNNNASLNIICSFSDFASIAERIAGEHAVVSHIAHGEQDPHFVPPKPSYAMMLRNADLWITTGMDLEGWSTTLLDKARNKQIMDGEIGFVSVSDGVNVLQKVEKADRTEGDVHLMGNPHINTGPINWKIIATNITTGLIKVDPTHASDYQSNLKAFNDQVDRAMFGDELVEIFGGDMLSRLLENKTLFTFLEKEYQGEKLSGKLGGWLKQMEPLREKKIVAYHKNWIYFIETFGLEIAGYIEPKPGIPPSAKHVQKMIGIIKDQDIKLMLVASYFEKNSARMIEEKTGIKALFLPLYVGGIPEVTDNFQLVDYWIDQVKSNIQ